MSEEEKKAIERVKRLLSFNLTNPFLDHEADDIVTILNLIEKQNNRLEQLEKENEELKEKIKKAYKYITDEMYIDDNPTICGDEWEDTITELPISLHLYNEDLRELLDLLD